MNNCPCCADILLKHIRRTEVYWFCRTCWQEMPVLSRRSTNAFSEPVLEKKPKKVLKQVRNNKYNLLGQRCSLKMMVY